MAKFCAAAKLGVVAPGAVVFKSTDTVLESVFATTMSGLPSPLRSAIDTEAGLLPVAKFCLAAKLGVAAPGAVVFKNTDTVLDPAFATTMSGLPSPLRSAIDTEAG